MKYILAIAAVIAIVWLMVVMDDYLCPNGYNDATRWGCGYSQEDLNKMKCEANGGIYMYGGGMFSSGNCAFKPLTP